jgi:putative CocE/NonD family hydrolase
VQLAWFDHWLKGAPLPDEPAVELFEMGGDRWRGFSAWPEPAPTRLFLASDGLAATDGTAGTLAPSPASSLCIDRLVFDPWRPTPSHGGHTGPVYGACDRAAVDARTDIATYTGPALERALHLAGDVAAEIHATADAPCFDLFAVLSDVAPDGKVWNLTQGIVRVENARTPVRVEMRGLCAVLKPGHRLRLSLAAGAFPAFSVNPGTGHAPGIDAVDAQRVLCLSIGSGSAAASSLLLPVVPE